MTEQSIGMEEPPKAPPGPVQQGRGVELLEALTDFSPQGGGSRPDIIPRSMAQPIRGVLVFGVAIILES
jgi:hypothetical protein